MKAFLLFLAGFVWAESIDEQIIKNLDFFTNMEVIEEMDTFENLVNPEESQELDAPFTSSSSEEKT